MSTTMLPDQTTSRIAANSEGWRRYPTGPTERFEHRNRVRLTLEPPYTLRLPFAMTEVSGVGLTCQVRALNTACTVTYRRYNRPHSTDGQASRATPRRLRSDQSHRRTRHESRVSGVGSAARVGSPAAHCRTWRRCFTRRADRHAGHGDRRAMEGGDDRARLA